MSQDKPRDVKPKYIFTVEYEDGQSAVCDSILGATMRATGEEGATITAFIDKRAFDRVVEALKDVKQLLECQNQTTFPINVREPDGSISQHRPPSVFAEKLKVVKEALKDVGVDV